MKASSICLSVLLSALGVVSASGGTAQVQISNHSIKMHSGACSCGFGIVFKIHFSTYSTDNPLQANGEIAPRPPGSATTHWSYLIFEDSSMWAVPSFVEINLPLAQDENGNGVSDFFELGREISMVSSGYYESDLLGGTLEMTWTRAAGSPQGSCQLYMVDNMLGRNGPFNHTFELIQGSGTLDYTRAGDAVAGSIDLQINETRVKGPVQLSRNVSDPCNVLTLGAGAWTNSESSFIFDEATLIRDPSRPTEYKGTLSNPGAIYGSWTLRIISSDDSDGNGVPDLSDNLPTQPLPRPAIGLVRSNATLQLAISGDKGLYYEVQAANSPSPTAWETVKSFVMTNSPTAVELSRPENGPRFWRVKAYSAPPPPLPQ